MSVLVNVFAALMAFVAMEAVAYLSHRYVMHGWLWRWHRSHHEPRTGAFEKNDLFAVVFSLPSILLIYLGTRLPSPLLLSIGIGILGYGIVYFVFHDVIVHRRIRLRWKPKSAYMKRLIKAHWLHHASHQRDGAISFGFLYSPPIERLEDAHADRKTANRAQRPS